MRLRAGFEHGSCQPACLVNRLVGRTLGAIDIVHQALHGVLCRVLDLARLRFPLGDMPFARGALGPFRRTRLGVKLGRDVGGRPLKVFGGAFSPSRKPSSAARWASRR